MLIQETTSCKHNKLRRPRTNIDFNITTANKLAKRDAAVTTTNSCLRYIQLKVHPKQIFMADQQDLDASQELKQ